MKLTIDEYYNGENNCLKTAVYYKHYKYIPGNSSEIDPGEPINKFKADKKYYYGLNNYFNIDFTEYDFSYIPEKFKINNNPVVNKLDIYSSTIVGEDYQKVEDVLFPTFIEGIASKMDIFGVIERPNSILYVLEVPEDYSRIELYSDKITSGNNSSVTGFVRTDYAELLGTFSDLIKPDLVIDLDPDRELYNNPEEFYFNNDPLHNRLLRTKVIGNTEYSKQVSEIFCKKLVLIEIKNESGNVDFAIVNYSWNNNKNPNRYKNKFTLRNDEFVEVTSDSGISIVSNLNSSGFFNIDSKSGTLLGNDVMESIPFDILQEKIDNLDDTIYSPFRRYLNGETTIYKGDTYKSLKSWNLGNNPALSNSWILESGLEFSPIIYSRVIGQGYFMPDQVSIPSNDYSVSYTVENMLGWEFERKIYIKDSSDNLVLLQGVDVQDELVDNRFSYTVTIDDWTDILSDSSDSSIYASFTEVNSVAAFKLKIDGVDFSTSDWAHEDFSLSVNVNGESETLQDSGTYMYFEKSNPSSTDLVTLIPSYNNDIYNLTINVEKEGPVFYNVNNNLPGFSDNLNYTKATYTMNMTHKEAVVRIKISNNSQYEDFTTLYETGVVEESYTDLYSGGGPVTLYFEIQSYIHQPGGNNLFPGDINYVTISQQVTTRNVSVLDGSEEVALVTFIRNNSDLTIRVTGIGRDIIRIKRNYSQQEEL